MKNIINLEERRHARTSSRSTGGCKKSSAVTAPSVISLIRDMTSRLGQLGSREQRLVTYAGVTPSVPATDDRDLPSRSIHSASFISGSLSTTENYSQDEISVALHGQSMERAAPSNMPKKRAKPIPKKASSRRYFFTEWRKFRSLTQEKLAALAKLSTASISQLETGKQGFTDATLEALAEALQCNPGDLLARNPLDPAQPWSIWERLTPSQQRQALRLMNALSDEPATGTGG